jgi:hypothetical protein
MLDAAVTKTLPPSDQQTALLASYGLTLPNHGLVSNWGVHAPTLATTFKAAASLGIVQQL